MKSNKNIIRSINRSKKYQESRYKYSKKRSLKYGIRACTLAGIRSMSELEINYNSSPEQENYEQVFDEEGFYGQEITLDETLLHQIEKTELNLLPSEVFKKRNIISKFLKPRKNTCITCISTREYPLDIKDTNGLIEIPFFNKQEIDKRISSLSNHEERKSIGFIHIGTIKIMIKSTFNTGIDSPLKIALLDRRIKNPSEAIFGGIQGNLAYGKIMFTCSPNIGVSLKDKEINQILCLAHKFERNDLMKQGNHPYTITYKIGYTLSNSHHSMEFKTSKRIEINDLFKNIEKISSIPTKELTPLLDTWTMDLNNRDRKILGQSPKLIIQDEQEKGEPSKRSFSRILSRKYALPPTDDLYTVSRRINIAAEQLDV